MTLFKWRASRVASLVVILEILGNAGLVSAVDIDFESPTYSEGSIIEQDGWITNGYVTGDFFGGPNGDVTISSTAPLAGSQSLRFEQTAVTGGDGSPGASDVGKPEVITIAPGLAGADLMVSYLISVSGNAQSPDGNAGVFLSHDSFGGLSPIFAQLNGSVLQVADAGGIVTEVSDFVYFAGDVLEMAMNVDFDTSTYELSVNNITTGEFEFARTFGFLAPFNAEGANGEYLVDVGTLLRRGTAQIDNLSLVAGTGPLVTELTWNSEASGNWNQATNWTPGGVPGSSPGRQTAIFGDAITSTQTVFTNSSRSVNSIQFDNANTYVVAGTGSVNLQADASGETPVNPSIEVDSGHHQFQVAVNLLDDTMVTVADDASLDFNNQIDLGGNTLTTSGTVRINHSTIGGGTVMNLGSLQAADATSIGGDLVSLGELVVDLDAQEVGSFIVDGNATLAGILDVNFDGSAAPASSYTIVTASGILDAAALMLDASDAAFFKLAATDHALTLTPLTAVPEPAALALLIVGAATVCVRRTRSFAKIISYVVGLSALLLTANGMAVTIDFENPPYNSGQLIGQQSWVRNGYVGAANVNGDVNVSATSPLSGSQSLQYTQTSVPVGFGAGDVSMASVAFGTADGTTAVDLTATVQMKADSNAFAAGQLGIFLSGNAFGGLSPIGAKLDGVDSNTNAGSIQVLHTTGFVNAMSYTPNHVLEFQFGVNFDNGGDYELAVRDITAGGPLTPLVGPAEGGRFAFFNAPNVFPADGDGVTYTVDVGTLLRGGVGQIDNISIAGDEFTQAVWGGNVSGDWHQNANWIPNMIPGVAEPGRQIAIFGSAITTPQTVFTNSTVSVNGVQFDNANKYVVAGGGSVDLKANTSGGSPVNPTINVANGSHEFQVAVNILDNTTVTVAEGASLDFNNDANLGGKTLTTSGAVNLNVGVTGGGAITNSGSLGTAGTTPIEANLNSTGKLVIDLGPNNTDFFDITGNATLSGLLDIVLEPDFIPTGAYTVLTVSGTLNAASLALDPSDTGMFSLGIVGKSLVLTAGGSGVPGDYNSDGIVDAADYTVWRDALGSSTVLPNRDPDNTGNVSAADYNSWKAHFGQSAGAGGGAAELSGAVPEPNSLLLMLVATAIVAFWSNVARQRQLHHDVARFNRARLECR